MSDLAERTIAFAVNTGKVSASTLARAFQQFLYAGKRLQRAATQKNAPGATKHKLTMDELMEGKEDNVER